MFRWFSISSINFTNKKIYEIMQILKLSNNKLLLIFWFACVKDQPKLSFLPLIANIFSRCLSTYPHFSLIQLFFVSFGRKRKHLVCCFFRRRSAKNENDKWYFTPAATTVYSRRKKCDWVRVEEAKEDSVAIVTNSCLKAEKDFRGKEFFAYILQWLVGDAKGWDEKRWMKADTNRNV